MGRRGLASARLSGEVADGGVLQMLELRDPATGAQLRQAVSGRAVAGFDLTFKAPKSVSILFGIADDAVRREVRAAHQAAVIEALGYMEREACRTRRGHAGKTIVAGGGFVAAGFEHRTSREDLGVKMREREALRSRQL